MGRSPGSRTAPQRRSSIYAGGARAPKARVGRPERHASEPRGHYAERRLNRRLGPIRLSLDRGRVSSTVLQAAPKIKRPRT